MPLSAPTVITPGLAPEIEATLKGWVREHRVTWELGAWQELVEHRATTVGFELRLFGRSGPDGLASPGGGQDLAVFERLRAIALAALPKEQRETECEVEPFDASLHLSPESAWMPEVQLTVHILHHDGYLRPLDEGEKRCAEEVQKALRALGVRPKSRAE